MGIVLDGAKVRIAAVVLAYFVVSISLVFSNKLLLSNKGATIEAPMFITWFQVGIGGNNAKKSSSRSHSCSGSSRSSLSCPLPLSLSFSAF